MERLLKMANSPKKQFLIGLPGAGKTTFLAALWHVLFESDVDGCLRFSHLDGDTAYLNKIRDTWSNVNQSDRTQIGMEQVTSIFINDPVLDATTEVVIPDMSGEAFEQQWTDRTASSGYVASIRQSIGGLLLIHPHVREESLISAAEGLIKNIGIGSLLEKVAEENLPVPWESRNAPTQVQLVDLLQFVQKLCEGRSIRLAVVVSAWDLINEKNPNIWVEKRLPLLHQFLTANQDVFETTCFGVSAQGGKIPDKKTTLEQIVAPSHRIKVVHGQGVSSHDITLPLRWTMRWD
ncbi:MAG TPA: hypothetical protein DDZ51_05945 [Planctomycetaceae bacterium]|nr:hypothetical protein [Planctomycetaceae bacterium]